MDIHGAGLFSISQNHLFGGEGEDDECSREVIMMVVNDTADGYS